MEVDSEDDSSVQLRLVGILTSGSDGSSSAEQDFTLVSGYISAKSSRTIFTLACQTIEKCCARGIELIPSAVRKLCDSLSDLCVQTHEAPTGGDRNMKLVAAQSITKLCRQLQEGTEDDVAVRVDYGIHDRLSALANAAAAAGTEGGAADALLDRALREATEAVRSVEATASAGAAAAAAVSYGALEGGSVAADESASGVVDMPMPVLGSGADTGTGTGAGIGAEVDDGMEPGEAEDGEVDPDLDDSSTVAQQGNPPPPPPPLPTMPRPTTTSSTHSPRAGTSAGAGAGAGVGAGMGGGAAMLSENALHAHQRGVTMAFDELTPRQVEALAFLIHSFPRLRWLEISQRLKPFYKANVTSPAIVEKYMRLNHDAMRNFMSLAGFHCKPDHIISLENFNKLQLVAGNLCDTEYLDGATAFLQQGGHGTGGGTVGAGDRPEFDGQGQGHGNGHGFGPGHGHGHSPRHGHVHGHGPGPSQGNGAVDEGFAGRKRGRDEVPDEERQRRAAYDGSGTGSGHEGDREGGYRRDDDPRSGSSGSSGSGGGGGSGGNGGGRGEVAPLANGDRKPAFVHDHDDATPSLLIRNLPPDVKPDELVTLIIKHTSCSYIEEKDVSIPPMKRGGFYHHNADNQAAESGAHAYINFHHLKDSRNAKKALDGKIFGGRTLEIDYSMGRATKVVWVGGLGPPGVVSERMIEDKMRGFGRIESIDIKRRLKHNDAFAFVVFEDIRDSQRAVKSMGGSTMIGPMTVRIGYSSSAKDGPGPGTGSGSGSGSGPGGMPAHYSSMSSGGGVGGGGGFREDRGVGRRAESRERERERERVPVDRERDRERERERERDRAPGGRFPPAGGAASVGGGGSAYGEGGRGYDTGRGPPAYPEARDRNSYPAPAPSPPYYYNTGAPAAPARHSHESGGGSYGERGYDQGARYADSRGYPPAAPSSSSSSAPAVHAQPAPALMPPLGLNIAGINNDDARRKDLRYLTVSRCSGEADVSFVLKECELAGPHSVIGVSRRDFTVAVLFSRVDDALTARAEMMLRNPSLEHRLAPAPAGQESAGSHGAGQGSGQGQGLQGQAASVSYPEAKEEEDEDAVYWTSASSSATGQGGGSGYHQQLRR